MLSILINKRIFAFLLVVSTRPISSFFWNFNANSNICQRDTKKSTWIDSEPWGHRFVIYETINPGKQVNIYLFFCRWENWNADASLAIGTTKSGREQGETHRLDNLLGTAGGALTLPCCLKILIVIVSRRFEADRAQSQTIHNFSSWNQTWKRERKGILLMSIKASESPKDRKWNGAKSFHFFVWLFLSFWRKFSAWSLIGCGTQYTLKGNYYIDLSKLGTCLPRWGQQLSLENSQRVGGDTYRTLRIMQKIKLCYWAFCKVSLER